MDAVRLTIAAEPAPVPRRCQLVPPSELPQSPCCATPAIIKSSLGFEDTKVKFPHSDAIPARFEVTLTQSPGDGELRTGLPLEVEGSDAVTGGVGAASLEEGREDCASVAPLQPSWMMTRDKTTINNFILLARRIHDSTYSKIDPTCRLRPPKHSKLCRQGIIADADHVGRRTNLQQKPHVKLNVRKRY